MRITVAPSHGTKGWSVMRYLRSSLDAGAVSADDAAVREAVCVS